MWSPSKIYLFSVDGMHDYYLQAWENLLKADTFKLTESDLVRIHHQNMRVFPGNSIHGERFRNETSTSNSRL